MTTVSIVSPNAPRKVNATIRCASVGFGRGGAGGFVSVGGVVTVGRVLRLPFSRDHAPPDHTLNAFHDARVAANQRKAAGSQEA